jgi:hypothetical protein
MAGLLLLPAQAIQAGDLFKCGTTFQDRPCASLDVQQPGQGLQVRSSIEAQCMASKWRRGVPTGREVARSVRSAIPHCTSADAAMAWSPHAMRPARA